MSIRKLRPAASRTRPRALAATVIVVLIASAASAGLAQSSPVLRGGVTQNGSRPNALQSVCHNSTVFSARSYPDQDPKRTAPGCANVYSAYQCNAPPSWPYPEDWKILERKGANCLVALPLSQAERERFAQRTLLALSQVEREGYWRQCDGDPWDATKVLCDKPPWTPPPRRNVGANGACADGSNGGGPNSTNYYGCPTGPSGPYLGRIPPTGSIATPRGTNAYPRNRVICQATRTLTPAEIDEMNRNPYYCPPTPAPVNDGSNPYTYTPPHQDAQPTPTPVPQKLVEAVPKNGGWEFTFENGSHWTAPATTTESVPKYRRVFIFKVVPDTAEYNYVNSGRLVQPFVWYKAYYNNETLRVKRMLKKQE